VFSKEIIDLLLQVLSSWQVIAVTLAIIAYMSLVSWVTRASRRPRVSKSKARKKNAASAAGPGEAGSLPETANDELGLEEA
jgi:membrane protein implicated in regulation of membrane protease activity